MLRRRRGGRDAPTVALAGAGSIATVHALAASAAGMEVRAVASAGGRSARHLAGQLDARRCRPEDLPAGADLLVVATPPDSHVGMALQGLDAGARVLVEKPLAVSLADADRLVEASGRPGAVLRCAENLLHAPAWTGFLTDRARLGRLGHLSVRARQPPPDWGHFTHPLVHGGVLFDLGPHPVALALLAADEPPVSVSAHLSTSRTDGADDDARLTISFASGLDATLEVSWVSDVVVWDLQAASDSGVSRLELFPNVALESDGRDVAVPLRLSGGNGTLEQYGYVDQLVDIAAEAPAGQTAAAARAVLEVICAAYLSAGRGGERVALPLEAPRDASPMQLWTDR